MDQAIPLQIGVTGGIGAGKSIVCRIFSCLGIPVYDADSRAKWLTDNDLGIREKVETLLGREAYNSEGLYNRTYVASQVFGDPVLLGKLNEIIHPAVLKDTAQWARRCIESPYLIKEAAIMKKAGADNSLEYVIVVQAPVELRLQRIRQRDKNRTEKEIRSIIERQVSDEERDKIADYRIINDEKTALLPQVLLLHELFLKK